MEDKVKASIAEVFEEIAEGLCGGGFGRRARVGLTLPGSELGDGELLRGALLAQQQDPAIKVVIIGTAPAPPAALTGWVPAADAKQAHEVMNSLLDAGKLDAGVTMHYSFPISVSTVGRVLTPGFGRAMYVANTTGTADTERVSAMLKNAISAVAVAKACGNPSPTVGILNIDGARQVERALGKLAENGYPVHFTKSARTDGGVVMRGNDLLQGVPDIMVMDSLTGNVVMKLMSAFTTGGSYESLGDGYGPGVGPGYNRIVNIISRASGAPVVAGALRYAGACARGGLLEKVEAEFALAKKAGLDSLLAGFGKALKGLGPEGEETVAPPPEKVVNEEITGVEILVLEDAVRVLWKKQIYASSGMGCTGPVIMVAEEDAGAARSALREADFL